MAVLGNARHERVAQLLAAGKRAEEAAADAGYKGTAKSFGANARKMAQRLEIKARVEELQGEVAEKIVEYTADWIIERFGKIAGVAIDPADIKAADVIAALRELAKIRNLYPPTKIAPTNPEGDGPAEGNVTITFVEPTNGRS